MPDLRGELHTLWPSWAAGDARRVVARRKLLILGEDHLALVKAKIADIVRDEAESVEYLQRFASTSPNLLKAVTDAIAVAYRSSCVRTLRGASPEVARAFADLVTESGISRKAAGINARSWVAGAHIVAPHFTKRNKLALDIIGPDHCDVRRDGEDIDAVLWAQGGGFVLLDHERWRYFDGDGVELTDDAVYHAVGVCPAVPFVSADGGPDFWAAAQHSGLVDATLMIAYKYAWGLFVQQTHGTPITSVVGNIEKVAQGQTCGHPLFPVQLPEGAQVNVEADRVVSPDGYLAEIEAMIAGAVSAEGLPPGSITMSANVASGLQVDGSRLGDHRRRQVPPLQTAELALWPIVVDMVRGSTHRLARVLPPGDEVRDMLRIRFADLTSPAEQLARTEAMKAGLAYGITSPDDIILHAQPELSPEDVAEMRRERLADYIEFIEPLVSRNVPADAPEARGVQTIAQEQGRTGGVASGRARSEQAQEQP